MLRSPRESEVRPTQRKVPSTSSHGRDQAIRTSSSARRLYDPWRKRAMRRIYGDQALRRKLEEKAGIIIGRNEKTGTITMHVRTKSVTGQRVQTHIDFDHASIRHEDAVRQAIAANDFRQLTSTVNSNNLQLMTARENRNFIEAIRQAEREMVGAASATPPPHH
jgi:hypothetical protein